MPGRRIICMAAVAVFAVVAGVLVSGSSHATTYRPVAGAPTLSDTGLGAHADIAIPFHLNSPDSNFGGFVISLTSPEFVQSPTTIGKTVGYLTSSATLGLLNQGCFNNVTVNFRLYSASTDNSAGNTSGPFGTADTPVLNFTQDDGDINNDGTVDNPARANNGIPDGAEWYPVFLNGVFSNKTPTVRYFGWQTVPGTPTRVIIQIIMFAPGDLFNIPSIPSSGLLTAAQGSPSAVILNDPTTAPPQAIEDFCSPLDTTTTLCGQTDSAPDNPQAVIPDCDVGVGSEVRGTNPGVPGTYLLKTASISQRDADMDGIENWLDPCPLAADVGWDPRVPPAVNQAAGFDNDADNLSNACDPTLNTLNLDQDGDTWYNRVDLCPLVFNPATSPPNTGQNDSDILLGGSVPDGGPPMDYIGPECDPNPTSPNGHYHGALTVGRMCLGGTDDDADGVCDTYPGENDADTDTDNDGVEDGTDNCIAVSNPYPAGLYQMSPDVTGNGQVQIDDISFIAGRFGKAVGQNGYSAFAELASQNGVIQIDDVAAGAGAFGRRC